MPILQRILNLFSAYNKHREIDEELRAHIELRTEDNMAAGMTGEAAARDARMRFGNLGATKERVWAMDSMLGVENVWSDLRYSLRQLRRSPGFAATVVITLALAIGANLGVFQLLYGVLLAKLPVPHPEQLYAVHGTASPFDGDWSFSYAGYQRLAQSADALGASIAARSGGGEGVLEESNGASSRIDFQMVSGNFFSVLGVAPYTGRLFSTPDDQENQREWPAVLNYGYAASHFGLSGANEQNTLGKHLVLNRIPIVIVGIAPPQFHGVMKGSQPDVWLPIEAQATNQVGTGFDSLGPGYNIELGRSWLPQQGIYWLWLIARSPADPKKQANQWTQAIAPDIALLASATKDPHLRQHVLETKVTFTSAATGQGNLGERYSKPLMLLMTMAGLIFLIGCLNLANLQLARLADRQREIALRIALGATRWRVLRQALVEDLLLAGLGGIAALITGQIASRILLLWASGRNSTIPIDLHIDLRLVALGILLLLTSLVSFSIIPAWWATRRGFLAASSHRGSASGAQSRAATRTSSLLLAGQVCLSIALVGMAGLFGETLVHIGSIDAGMDREHILSVHFDMDSTKFADAQKNLPALYDSMIERVQTLPDVRSASVSMCSLLRCGWNTAFHAFGQPERAEIELHGEENHVGPGYFKTLGIPLLQGRDFAPTDLPGAPRAIILSQSYARQLFGNENPLGHWMGYEAAPHDHSFVVVGVVGDAHTNGLRNAVPPIAYLAIKQNSSKIGIFVARVKGSPAAQANEIRAALLSVKPDLPITEITDLNTEFDDGLTAEKLLAHLTDVFAALSLALAALGFYGLLSFRVGRRRAEIGIRMALGAARGQVVLLVFRQTLVILIGGIVPGIVLTHVLSGAARSVLWESGKTGALPLLLAVMVLVVVAMLATFIPAHRAASIDPVEALRAE